MKREIKRKGIIVSSSSIVAVVVLAPGSIMRKLDDWIAEIDISLNTTLLQKTLLETARTLRNVLEY